MNGEGGLPGGSVSVGSFWLRFCITDGAAACGAAASFGH